MFVGLAVLAGMLANQLDPHRSREELARYYNDFRGSSHEWRELLATFVVFVAAFCFVWFLRRLYVFIRAVDDSLAMIAAGGGFVAITLLMAGFVAFTAVGTTLAYSDDYTVNLDTAILMTDIGLFLYTAAAAGAATMIFATSIAARRRSLMPAWLTWPAFVVAIACLLMIVLDGLSLILFVLWVLAVSGFLIRRSWSGDTVGVAHS